MKIWDRLITLVGLIVLICIPTLSLADKLDYSTGLKARERVNISGGKFTPLYGLPKGVPSITVHTFKIDKYPVTNQDFHTFVLAKPEWSKQQVLALFADRNYLKHWEASADHVASQPSGVQLHKPVVNISWFAANDFCLAQGGRLPKLNEWEYVAAADQTKHNALRDPKFVEQLLAWYSRPFVPEQLPEVGKQQPNAWGVYDLHGLVWEWTLDFNSVFVTGDNRQEGDDLKNLFCGAGATNAADKSDYAAFMRYALRNSVQASYTLENLGFRCAYD